MCSKRNCNLKISAMKKEKSGFSMDKHKPGRTK
jgi:hypothetical protein